MGRDVVTWHIEWMRVVPVPIPVGHGWIRVVTE